VGAAIAHVWLDVDAAELGAHDRARGTGFQAAGLLAMLTDVGGELPGNMFAGIAAKAGLGIVFNELDVPPGGSAYRAGVVVGKAAPVQAIFADAVPLLAGYLAGLAADAQG